ncbi:serine-rich adhesin for platelets [Palaemon carinicauda]|uniref:serine-rich adhesin for platelets n=1 Tax=Palaemon carinicauda TaxID=392227 RepID=UPI0035B5F665
MSSKKITYSSDFKLKVLDYYFKHGGDDKFGLKKKTAGHFNIDKKTISRMLSNPDMVKRARKLITSKKTTPSVKTPPTGSRPQVKPAVRKAGSTPSKVSNTSNKSASSSQSSASSSSSNKASTSSTTSTKSVSSSSKQVNSTPSGSNKTPSQKPKSGIPEDKGSPGVEVFELPEDPDYSLLKRSINAATSGVGGLAKLLVTGTEEVRNVVLNECDVILECKVCRSLFRSVVNFLAHKRIYCQDEFADVRTIFHKGDVQGVTSQSSTVVVEPEPPPDGEDLDTMRTTIPTTYTSPIKSAQGKAKRSGIDSIALKLARKRKAYHASSSSSSTNTGSSSYYKSLDEVSRSRDKLSRDCSVILEDIGGVTNAVFQSFIPPGSASPSTPMSSLIEEASHSKSGVTVAINQNGEIVKTASGEIMSMEVDQPSAPADSKDLTCLLCNTRFATQKTLSVHQRSHHGFERCIYSCPICQASFLSMWAVVKHLQRTHKKNKSQIERLRKVVRKNVRKKIIYQKAEKDSDNLLSGKDDNEDEEIEDDEEKREEPESAPVKSAEVITPKKSGIGSPVQITPVKGSSHKGWRSKDGVRWMCNVCRKMFITRAASLAHVATHIVCNFEPKAVLVNIQSEQELPESKDASISERLQEVEESEVEKSEAVEGTILAAVEDTEVEQESVESEDGSSLVENEKCFKVTKETVSKLKKKYLKIAVSSTKTNEELDHRESLKKRIRQCDSKSTITSLKSGKILVKEVSNNIEGAQKGQMTISHSKTQYDFKTKRNLKMFIGTKECEKKTVLVKSMLKGIDGDSNLDKISRTGSNSKGSRNIIDVTVIEGVEESGDVTDKRLDGEKSCDKVIESKSIMLEKTKRRECDKAVSKVHPEDEKSEVVSSKCVVKKELTPILCPMGNKNSRLEVDKLAALTGDKHNSDSLFSNEKITDKKDFKKDIDANLSKYNACSLKNTSSNSSFLDKEANLDLSDTINKENIGSGLEEICTTENIKVENCFDEENILSLDTVNLKVKEENDFEVKEEKVDIDGTYNSEENEIDSTYRSDKPHHLIKKKSINKVLEANNYSSSPEEKLKPKDSGAPSSGFQAVLKGVTLPNHSITSAVSVTESIKKSIDPVNPLTIEASKSDILFTLPSSKVIVSKSDVSSQFKMPGTGTCKLLYTVAPSATDLKSSDGVSSFSRTDKDVCHASSKSKNQKLIEMSSVKQELSKKMSISVGIGKDLEFSSKLKTFGKSMPDAVATKPQKTTVCHPYHTFTDAVSPNTGALDSSVSPGVSKLKIRGSAECGEKSGKTLHMPKKTVSQPASELLASSMLKSLASVYDAKANARSTAVPKASSTYAAQLKKYADSPSEDLSVGALGTKLPKSEMKIKKDVRNPLVVALRKDGTVITLPRKSADSPSTSMCATQSSSPKPDPIDPLVVAYRMTGTTIPIATQRIGTGSSPVKVKRFSNTKSESASNESTDLLKKKEKIDLPSVESSASVKTHLKAHGTYQSVHVLSEGKNKQSLVQYDPVKSPQDLTEPKSDTNAAQFRITCQGSYKVEQSGESEKTQSPDINMSSLTSSPKTVPTTPDSETTTKKVIGGSSGPSISIPESGTSLPIPDKMIEVLSKPMPSSINLAQTKKGENLCLSNESLPVPGSASFINTSEVSEHRPCDHSESQNILEKKSQNSPPVIPGLIPSYKMKLQRSNEVGSLSSVKKNFATTENVGNATEGESLKSLEYEETKRIQDADYQKKFCDTRKNFEIVQRKVPEINKSSHYLEKVKSKGTVCSSREKDTASSISSGKVQISEKRSYENPECITSEGFSDTSGNKDSSESKQVYAKIKKTIQDTEGICISSISGGVKPCCSSASEIHEENKAHHSSLFTPKLTPVSSHKVNTKKGANEEVWRIKVQSSLKSQGKEISSTVSGNNKDGIADDQTHNLSKRMADIEENFGFLEDETSHSSSTESELKNIDSRSQTYSQDMKRKIDSADCHYRKKIKRESSEILRLKERGSSQPEIKDFSSSDASFSEENCQRGRERFSSSQHASSSALKTVSKCDLLKDVNMTKVAPSELDPLTTDADSTIDEAAVIQSHTTFGDLSYDYDLNE